MNEMLHIDWTRCDGRGLCTELLPTVLVRDDWGYPLALHSTNGGRSNPATSSGNRRARRIRLGNIWTVLGGVFR
ncbi:ferredoxin [Arthrobacter sp. UYCu511]|uniref:ferredoxin n=1 Tax=Arthrobacter sp. UYCu511 TaxID=3156337 RepID=UPI003391B240